MCGRVPRAGGSRDDAAGRTGWRLRGVDGSAGRALHRRGGAAGDPLVRDRVGQWTYGFSVVVDDLRHGVDLVVRGRDLLDATPDQIRLARILGRTGPPIFAHHPLILRPDGSKLSKADAATSVRELRAAGRTAPELIGEAATAVRLIDTPRPIAAAEVGRLFERQRA